MTTKVRIEFPAPDHAPKVEVYAVTENLRDPLLLATLKPGELTEQYVYTGQKLLIAEKLD